MIKSIYGNEVSALFVSSNHDYSQIPVYIPNAKHWRIIIRMNGYASFEIKFLSGDYIECLIGLNKDKNRLEPFLRINISEVE